MMAVYFYLLQYTLFLTSKKHKRLLGIRLSKNDIINMIKFLNKRLLQQAFFEGLCFRYARTGIPDMKEITDFLVLIKKDFPVNGAWKHIKIFIL